MMDKLETYGEWTYRMAWLMEITAALIGLSVAGVMIIAGLQADMSKSGFLAPIVGQIGPAGAFIMVALAELTKIPLATLLFEVKKLAKPIVAVILLGMAFITFETVLTGLERAQTIRELAYSEIAEKIAIAEASIQNNGSSAEEGDQRIEQAEVKISNVIQGYEEQIRNLDSGVEKKIEQIRLNSISEENKIKLSSIERNISEIGFKLEELDNDWASWSGVRQKAFDDYVANITRDFNKLIDAGDTQGALKYRKEKLGSVATPKNKPDWKSKEKEYLDNTKLLRAQRQSLMDKKEAILLSANVDATVQQKIESFLNDVESQRRYLIEQISKANEQAMQLSARSLNFTESQITLAEDALKAEQLLKSLKAQRVREAKLDQVRRLASKWYGVPPEGVSDKQASSVALVWFTSLSLLAALAGPVTAVTALSLQRIAAQKRKRLSNPVDDEGPSAFHKFLQSCRLLIVHWRFERKQTVLKEVPVEKVIKEYVYLPVLADEPDDLYAMLEKELPNEIVSELKARVVKLQENKQGEAAIPAAEGSSKRARDNLGQFEADDPLSDDVNEAWDDGLGPTKKK